MSVDAHWYSTLFAWYAGASWFVSMVALTLLILIHLKKNGYFPRVSREHLHDLGKFLFAFSIFWTYLWFSQYMLIWYGNIGEETGYFKLRMDEYPVLFYGNLLINFVIPFFVLMRNDTKRKYGTLIFVAIATLFGHWVDYFLMIKPGVLHTAHAIHQDHVGDAHGATDGETIHLDEAMAHGEDHAENTETHADHSEADAHGDDHAGSTADHGDGHGDGHGHGSEFHLGFHFPGFLELGTAIGFLSLFLFLFYRSLASAKLTPKNDPFLNESVHHHV